MIIWRNGEHIFQKHYLEGCTFKTVALTTEFESHFSTILPTWRLGAKITR